MAAVRIGFDAISADQIKKVFFGKDLDSCSISIQTFGFSVFGTLIVTIQPMSFLRSNYQDCSPFAHAV